MSLLEQLVADQIERSERGDLLYVEAYLAEYSDLVDDTEAVIELIIREFRLREEGGEAPTLAEYVRRFPQFAERLERQLALQQAFKPDTAQDRSTSASTHGGVFDTSEAEVLQTRSNARLPRIPGFEMLHQVGSGGVGVVYKARQTALNRIVALKMSDGGSFVSKERRARFSTEAESAARIQNPNVAQIYEVGEHHGMPFIVMEYVAGGSLAEYLDGTPQPPDASAKFIESLAEAVHDAHENGVIHRDLKPGNILLASTKQAANGHVRNSTKCPLTARPKITDFGLAKQLAVDELADELDGNQSSSGLTVTGEILGTPSYMSPEQAEGRREVGRTTDVYGLGAILYELLTGRAPFRSVTLIDTLKQIVSEEPIAPRRLCPKVPRDLETICLKCLEKNARGRYPTAHELAEDLARWRKHEPIRARHVGTMGRLWRWSKRNPTIAILSALLVTSFFVGTAVILWQWQRERELRISSDQQAVSERLAKIAAQNATENERSALRKVERGAYPDRIRRAHREWLANNVKNMLETLESCPPELRHWEWSYLKKLPRQETQSWPAHPVRVRCADISLDSKWLATGSDDGAIKLWDSKTGRHLCTLRGHPKSYVTDVTFSPDGRLLGSSGYKGKIVLWRTKNWSKHHVISPGHGAVRGVAMSANGRLASVDLTDHVRVWDTATGKELYSLEQTGPLICVAVSPDGQRIVYGSLGAQARWLNIATGETKELRIEGGRTLAVTRAVWSDDDTWFAAAGQNRLIIGDAASGNVQQEFDLGIEEVTDLSYGSGRLALAGRHKSATVFEMPRARKILTVRGHQSSILAAALSRDGDVLFTADQGGVVKTWDISSQHEFSEWFGHHEVVHEVALSPDGQMLASASKDGTVRIWQTAKGTELHVLAAHHGGARCVAFSSTGDLLVSGGADRCVRVWDVQSGREIRCLKENGDQVTGVAIDVEGTQIASGCRDAKVQIWNAESGALRHVLIEPPSVNTVHGVKFSADGLSIAAGTGPTIRIWDTRTGRLRTTIAAHESSIWDMALVSGGRFATAAVDGSAKIWNWSGSEPELTLRAAARFYSIAATRDGQRAATAHRDGTLKIWDLEGRQELLNLPAPSPLETLVFSPDGQRIYAGSNEGAIVVWDIDR